MARSAAAFPNRRASKTRRAGAHAARRAPNRTRARERAQKSARRHSNGSAPACNLVKYVADALVVN
eukprot:11207064-Lingulodinium_polyedra.AAC.1